MRYLTWNGMELFRKPETAAAFAIREGKDPEQLKILVEGGRLVSPERWEIDELIAHIRDQSW